MLLFLLAAALGIAFAKILSEPLGPFWLQAAARDITSLVTIVSLGYLALARRWSFAGMVMVSVLGGTAISSAVKLLIQWARPDFSPEVVHLHGYSFPSGHSFLPAVTYLTLGMLLARVPAYWSTFKQALTIIVTHLPASRW